MAGYGYTKPSYGYYKPPPAPRVQQAGSLAMAAAGHTAQADPFGLSGGQASPQQAWRNANPPAAAPAPSAHAAWRLANPAAPGSVAGQSGGANTAPTPGAYDINTDPALQQITALTGMNDTQAQAAAMKQKRDQLLAYGDPNLAQSLLGDPTLAQAAGQNPTSTLAQLGDQRSRNLHGLTEGLNQANLLYSGYRVTQEEQAAKDFQNALAQAASGVNANLGGIDSQLTGTLGQNQAQRSAAMMDAYGRHSQDVGATPPPPDGTPPPPPDTSGGNVTLDPTGSTNPIVAALLQGAAPAGAAAVPRINPLIAALLLGAGQGGQASRTPRLA